MLAELEHRAKIGKPIQVGLIGTGAMGSGVARQIGKIPGMELSFIASRKLENAQKAENLYGKKTKLVTNALDAIDDPNVKLDVLVDASSSLEAAAKFSIAAIKRQAHVILMNSELDLLLGPYLHKLAQENNVIFTSASGDQHGVLSEMIDEIKLWGFDIVQAGNIKGFLDNYALHEQKREIAQKLNIDLQQCIHFTDGSKMAVEMALLCNGTNLLPFVTGMQGGNTKSVTEVLSLFDFDAYGDQGRVEYILGAQPGGGVYVVGRCEDPIQQPYLTYYKLHQKPPYYLFYRPYHLCNLEVPNTIAKVVLYGQTILAPNYGRLADVYAYAKQDLTAGCEFLYGFGDDLVYGLIAEAKTADANNQLPQALLTSSGIDKPRLKHAIAKDQPITWNDVELPSGFILDMVKPAFGK